MYFDAEKLINFCGKNKMTIEQFTLCYLTLKEKWALLYKYSEQVRPFPSSLVKDLEKRGFVIDANKEGEGYADNLIINDKFRVQVIEFLGEEPDSDEVWDLYPATFISSDGNEFNGRTLNREDFQVKYRKLLSSKRITHQQVMFALKEQILANVISMGIEKWFDTEQWTKKINKTSFTDDI
jgi:hypothetical protein